MWHHVQQCFFNKIFPKRINWPVALSITHNLYNGSKNNFYRILKHLQTVTSNLQYDIMTKFFNPLFLTVLDAISMLEGCSGGKEEKFKTHPLISLE